MQLGDVTGAFFESDETERGTGKLYMPLPKELCLARP